MAGFSPAIRKSWTQFFPLFFRIWASVFVPVTSDYKTAAVPLGSPLYSRQEEWDGQKPEGTQQLSLSLSKGFPGSPTWGLPLTSK